MLPRPPLSHPLPLLVFAFLGLLSCGEESSEKSPPADSTGTAGAAGQTAAPLCDVQLAQHPLVPTAHVEECSTLTDDNYNSTPPSSGNHYPRWAAFKTYDAPIPRGYYLHSLEHGAVIFFYNCPEGCAEDVATLQELISQLPTDPLCTAPEGPKRRMILLPEPRLTSRFAAAAWGWTLQAPCVDPSSFSAFARDHYAQSVENICADGVDILAEGIKPGCGD